jgi:hypothetical protein
MGIPEEFSEKMLVQSGRGSPIMDSANDAGRKIKIRSLFNPYGFPIVDLLLSMDSFPEQSFIEEILKPLSQEHSRNRLILLAEVCGYTLTILDAMAPKLCQRK